MTRVSVKEAYSNRDLIAQIARLKTYVEQGTFKEVSTSYSGGVLVLTFTAFDDSTQSFNVPMDSIVGITGDQVGNVVTLHVEFASGTVVDIPYTIANADTSPTPDTLGLRDGNGYMQAASPAVGIYDTNLANGTKVKNELDNYAPMVRTTGNQTINGVKNYQYAPKNDYGGSQSTSIGWFKLWESETSTTAIRRTTILKILFRDTGNYGVFSIVRRALSQTSAGMLYGNIPAGSVKITRDSGGKMTLWTNTTRTSAWIEVETSATTVSEADYSMVLNDNTVYTEPQAADYSWMWTL